jgi:hypothetical protein
LAALRIGRETIPSTALSSAGEYVPFEFLSVHLLSVVLKTNNEFLTFVDVLQNGHVEELLISNEFRSMSPAPPVHAFASFSGSAPENENFHL